MLLKYVMQHFNGAGISWIDIMQIFGPWFHETSHSKDMYYIVLKFSQTKN